jgi:hypothetical protein
MAGTISPASVVLLACAAGVPILAAILLLAVSACARRNTRVAELFDHRRAMGAAIVSVAALAAAAATAALFWL